MSHRWVWLLVASAAFAQDETTKVDPVRTEITVNEKISAEAPASISVLNQLQLRENPGVNLDDRLRSVPGFTLFRRSSSLVANPTTQGISLRGLGSSGASRTLVLWDGVPANDPFGGWVYWTRFAPEDIERVEVVRGASTSVFGDRALGGSIQLFTRPAEPWRLHASYEGGNRNTHQISGGISHLRPRWSFSTQGRAFRTDGYYIVEESRRGAADSRAGVDFAAGDIRADYLGGHDRFFLKLDALTEDRANGTVLQRNSTSLGNLSGHYYRERGSDTLSLIAWHGREEFRASFSAIAANRQTERLTMLQTVPAEVTGAAGLYRLKRGKVQALFGGDFTRVEGYSLEKALPTGFSNRGGVQWQRGAFLQSDIRIGWLQLFGGGRVHAAGVQSAFFSPSGGFVAGRGSWRARGSVYRSFRSPTLNELFREFRAGNAVTRANDQLKPEFSFGAEAGADWSGEHAKASITFFRTALSDLITNVTLLSTPALIERQRRNAGEAITKGIEANLSHRWSWFRADASWLFSDSRFANGRRIPQVPRHGGNLTLSGIWNRTLVSAGYRKFSRQFEDDLNTLILPGYETVQLSLRQGITESVAAFAVWENLLNKRFYTAFTPVPSIGAPRLWRAGLRWEARLRK
jgi:outer membrane receptor protein involved in Fe transport